MPDRIVDFVRGRWSSVPPQDPGVYLLRVPGSKPWAHYCDEAALAPCSDAERARGGREYFYLEGDFDGRPTRWDDPRVAQIALSNGWRESRSLGM